MRVRNHFHWIRALPGLLLLSLVLRMGLTGGAFAATTTPTENSRTYLPLVQNICAPVQLLQDGGFEAGLPNPVWQTSSNVFSDILDDTPLPPTAAPGRPGWEVTIAFRKACGRF